MAHEQERPRFDFYQAPHGPDAGSQYSDWTNAILQRGDALSKPLLMLMQNLAEKQGQQRSIAAHNAERNDTLQYQRGRDVVKDAQFQQEQALRQSVEDRQVQQDQYSKAQDTAGLDMTIASMTPDNFVEKTDPMLDKLVQMRSGMQPVPLSPMPQVAPHQAFLDTFIQQHLHNQERQQEQAAKQAALDQQAGYYKSAIQNHVANGLIPEVDVPMLIAGMGTPGGQARIESALEKGTQMGLKLNGRKEQLKELEAYAKEHPDDPNVAKWSVSLGFLKPMLKNGNGNDELWNHTIEAVQSGMYGTAKGSTKTPTMDVGGSKIDVPPYVANGRLVEGTLPQDVERWIKDTAFTDYQKDNNLKGDRGKSLEEQEREAIQKSYEDATRQRVIDQFGWKVNPQLPFDTGAQAPANSAPTSQAPAQQAAQQQDPTSGLPPEVLGAMHDAKAQGPEAVKAVLRSAIEADRKQSSLPENSGAVGSEFLKKDPEPKWWWSMNSAYAPLLKGGSVEKAHAAWAERWAKHFGGK